MHEINIVEICKSDIHQIRPLWEKLNELHCEMSSNFKEHFASVTFEQRIESLLSKEFIYILAIQVSEGLVGYCISTMSDGVGEVDSLFVMNHFRGKRLGVKLTEKAISWLESVGCKTIKLVVAEGNESVLEFYQQLGFKRRAYVLQLQKP